MVRELRTFQPLEGDPDALDAAFRRDPARWLPAARPHAEGGWVLRVRAGSLERDVHATLGEPWHVTRTSWRALSWEPLAGDGDAGVSRILPPLDGELGLHVDESGRATLVLDARYLPPGGILGAAADAVALHRLARLTGQRLLQDIGAGLRASSERNAPDHAGSPERR